MDHKKLLSDENLCDLTMNFLNLICAVRDSEKLKQSKTIRRAVVALSGLETDMTEIEKLSRDEQTEHHGALLYHEIYEKLKAISKIERKKSVVHKSVKEKCAESIWNSITLQDEFFSGETGLYTKKMKNLIVAATEEVSMNGDPAGAAKRLLAKFFGETEEWFWKKHKKMFFAMSDKNVPIKELRKFMPPIYYSRHKKKNISSKNVIDFFDMLKNITLQSQET